MKKIRYFKCSECSEIIERLVDDIVGAVDCTCGGMAIRQLSSPKCFQNTTGKSPSAR